MSMAENAYDMVNNLEKRIANLESHAANLGIQLALKETEIADLERQLADNKNLENNLESVLDELSRRDRVLCDLIDDMGMVRTHHGLAGDLLKDIMDKLEGMVGGMNRDGDDDWDEEE